MKNKRKTNNNSKYATIYSSNDHKHDVDNFNEAEKLGKVDWSSFRRLLLSDICVNSDIIETGCIGDVKLEDIQFALDHPHKYWRKILAVSEKLMRISPYYYRLNNLYSNMALFCWGIDLYDVKENVNIDTIKKSYNVLAAKLETMNLKHEFSKIMKYLPYQDIYCGLVVENSTDFFLQKIDFRICKLFQVQDGLYNFKINLSAIKPKELNAYPNYVQKAYIDFIEGKNNTSNWYLPPAEKQICIKLNSQWTYPYPLLIGLVRDILDLDIYKKLKLQSARTDNYKAILIEVPIDESTVDKPLLTPDALEVFAEINRQSMSDDIGIIHTLGAGEAISFENSNNTTNNVSDAVDEIYNSSGVSGELFNGSSSGTAVKFSVENDSGFIYGLYRQFERWTNRYIKLKRYNKTTYKFHFYLLDITIFNRDDVLKRYKESCTLGLPVVDKYLATLDMTPSRTLGAYITHNNIFDFYNKFKPLSSSYNATTTGEAGRPTNAENGELLSDEGEKTLDGEKNDR
jgi:hypothetical protein